MPATQTVLLLGTANSDGTFTGVSDDETTSVPVVPGQHTKAAIAIIGNGTISGGVVTIEEAAMLDGKMPYSGTWSALTTVTASALSGGAQSIYHIQGTALFPIRVRVSTAIAGGGGVSAVLRYQ